MRLLKLRRSAVIEFCVLAGLLLVVLLPVLEAGGTFRPGQTAEARPVEAANAQFDFLDVKGSVFLVTWEATGTGGWSWKSWAGTWDRRNSQTHFASMKGSAILSYSPAVSDTYVSPWLATSFEQEYNEKETYFGDFWNPFWKTGSCEYERYRHNAVDSARWTGTPDLRTDLRVYREGDAIYMDDPVYFLTYNQLYTIRHETTEVNDAEDCVLSTRTWDTQDVSYELRYDMRPARLTATDATSSTFSVSHEEVKSVELTHGRMNVTAKWTMTAQRVGECARLPEPIEAKTAMETSPGGIKVALERADAGDGMISPQGEASLKAIVTCDGKKVKNAELEVGLQAVEGSGDHLHISDNLPKPPGALKRAGDKAWTQIDEFLPSISMTTNNDGIAEFAFRPGRDERDGERGINGKYIVTARPALSPDSRKQLHLDVGRTDFVPLPVSSQNYVISRNDTAIHPEGSWGTPATIASVQQLAQEFRSLQTAHNEQLARLGKPTWTLQPLLVNDISLRYGGLFDVLGLDVDSGQVRGRPWTPPHKSHLNGEGVDFSKKDPWPVPYRKWLYYALKSLGSKYGTWVKEGAGGRGGLPNLHLEFNKNRAASQQVGSETGPDLAVGAFLSDPEERSGIAPGQTVTFTVGIDNLSGGGSAGDVLVSASLPAGLTFLSADPPVSSTGSGQLTWNLGTLEPGALPQTVDFGARVENSVAAGSVLTVTVEVSTTSAETALDNNRDDAPLLVQAPGPDLSVSSSLGAVTMTSEQPVVFTVNVANFGNMPASGVALSMTLPVSVTMSSASPAAASTGAAGTTWQLGTLAPDSEQTIAVTVALDPSLAVQAAENPGVRASSLLTYTLAVTSTTADTSPDNNAEQVVKRVTEAGSDVQTWYSVAGANAGLLPAAQEITYTVRYANYGNQVAPSSTLTVSLGSGLTLVQAQPAAGRTATSANFMGGVLGWDLGDLAVGAGDCVALRVAVGSAPEDGTLALAAIQTSGRDIRPENNVFSERFTVGTAVQPAPGQGTNMPVRLYFPALMRYADLSVAARTSVADTGSCQTAAQTPTPDAPTGQSPTPTATPIPIPIPTPTPTPTATATATATASATPTATATPTPTPTPSPTATPCLQWWCGGGWGAGPADPG